MQLIGGVMLWDPTHPLTTLGVLRALAREGDPAAQPVVLGRGSGGVVSSLGADSVQSTDQVWAVADMDLTNLAELRALAGCRRDDAPLLPALYGLDGPRFVRRLHGAFALALYDRGLRVLILAVDRFGMRRLYYTTDRSRTVFASRSCALAAVPGVAERVDLTAVYNYLNFGCVPAPGSIFDGVHRLAPGELLRVRAGDTRLETYWDMEYHEQPVRYVEGAAMLSRLVEEGVARALHGRTPKETGAFLSGGTDSSTVVGLLTRLTGERVNAFSIGFREPRYDERGYAELAARHFGAAHYTRIVSADDALAALPRLVEAYDEPFGNNSAIGALFCAELARECGMRCLLAGDGGDEIFGGNERYRTDRVFARYHRIPAAVRQSLVEPVLLGMPDGGLSLVGRAQRYVRRANLPNPRRFYSWEFFVAQQAEELLSPEFLAAADRQAPWIIAQAYFDRTVGTAELNRLLYLDLKVAIGDNDLLKVTRAAELAGVAARFPLLDSALVEFTGTLPADLKVRGLEKRYLFKRAFRSLLPPEILAKRKHGFGVPTSLWLKTHPGFRGLARDTLLSTRARQRGYFRAGALQRCFDLHESDDSAYYGDILWVALMLELWHRRHADARAAA